ncbi:hypothetical protein K402DRAFT_342624, partial [Aulographum hederae CBS 113979]
EVLFEAQVRDLRLAVRLRMKCGQQLWFCPDASAESFPKMGDKLSSSIRHNSLRIPLVLPDLLDEGSYSRLNLHGVQCNEPLLFRKPIDNNHDMFKLPAVPDACWQWRNEIYG